MLTGQRRSEVLEAQWSEIDLKKRLWTIPAERMKAGAAHVVPLCDEALTIINGLPRYAAGKYLFSVKSAGEKSQGCTRFTTCTPTRMRSATP
jgi:integrase